MVNAFSDYARPAQLQTGLMDLNRLIRDVVELYGTEVVDLASVGGVAKRTRAARGSRSKLRSKLLAVELDLDAGVPAIHADAGRLRQVLHNLLLNARDALADHTRPLIRIRTRHVTHDHGSLVQLTVEDNGPGIPAALMDNLFEPYVTTREKGTGLGLAIVKRIIEEHNGALVAENIDGGGARIRITLPAGETFPLDKESQTAAGLAASREQRA
jgi:nitrogen fixation/metabolism regulation signal transduction histidine kinase